MKVFLLLCFTAVSATNLSPVTRVVQLLEGLAKGIEKDSKTEEDLYESYVCWGKSVIEQKTASNAAANSRIGTLQTYIQDLDSGRITLTSERSDLEKDIADLMKDLEEAKSMRDKEAADFADAKTEMTSAIDALKSAMDVLGQATKDHKQGVFMAIHSRLNHGMEALAKQQQNLNHAVQLGEKFLDKADATFLRRLLTGDVETLKKPDWKKLNRKATFKMGYKARSFKIQDVLKKMHETFTANLQEATESENDAKASYTQLSGAKQAQLTAAQDALTKSEVENGARGQSKADSQEEVDALTKQVANDEKFIQETTASLDKKKAEWKARSELRSAELAAISKAVSILHSDDARDLFKKSFASQGFFFLQEGQHSSNAARVIRTAAQKSGDARLLALATLVAEPKSAKVNFGPIIAKIDKMVANLKGEEEEDLKIKEECENGRMEDTRTAAQAGRDIDDMTDAMSKLAAEIEQIGKEIVSLSAEKKQTQQELKEAQELRKKENAEWMVSNKEDGEAAALVMNARDVLADFYKDKDGFAFVQKEDAPEVVAGEAPPPPPSTFEGPGTRGKDAQGIVAILEMIHQDIVNDKNKAKAEEDDSQAKFDAFKKSTQDQIKSLGEQIAKQKGLKGKKETEHGKTKDQRRTKKQSLDAVMKKMEDINPNCEYFTVNYKLRRTNRAVEVDGLVKAKAILQGGKFN